MSGVSTLIWSLHIQLLWKQEEAEQLSPPGIFTLCHSEWSQKFRMYLFSSSIVLVRYYYSQNVCAFSGVQCQSSRTAERSGAVAITAGNGCSVWSIPVCVSNHLTLYNPSLLPSWSQEDSWGSTAFKAQKQWSATSHSQLKKLRIMQDIIKKNGLRK